MGSCWRFAQLLLHSLVMSSDALGVQRSWTGKLSMLVGRGSQRYGRSYSCDGRLAQALTGMLPHQRIADS